MPWPNACRAWSHVRHRPAKEGLGRAYLDGFSVALDMGADYIIQMDADFSHPPDAIPTMLQLCQEYDVVVGSRYVRGGRLDERWSWWRRFLSWWANEVWSRTLLGLTHARHHCRVQVLAPGDPRRHRAGTRVFSNGYAFQVEMAYLTEKLGYRIREIPIYFEDRRIGRSKMSVPVKIQGASGSCCGSGIAIET